MRSRLGLILAVLCSLAVTAVHAQPTPNDRVRISTWNVTGYNLTTTNQTVQANARRDAFRTSLYGSFEGRSFAPDVLLGQEFTSQDAVNDFLNVLNTGGAGVTDWASAPFVNGPDTDSVLFYRTSKAILLNTVVAYNAPGTVDDQPRNTMRYDLQLLNDPNNSIIAMYNTHMKSGSTGALNNPAAGTDRQRRVLEAQHILQNVATLPGGYQFLVAGDFNIQNSAEDAMELLVGSVANYNTGPFRDPINTPGNWNNNANFRFVHTQSPSDQMDDRLDMILLSSGLVDGIGTDYAGNPLLAYSTTTWNDPNHSYRAWGNDGASFDTSIRVAGNEMVGATVAQSLIDSVGGDITGGHLPVFLELRLVAAAPEPGAGWLMTVTLVVVVVAGIRLRRGELSR